MGIAGRDWMRERARPLQGGSPITWWIVTLCVVSWFLLAGGARTASPWAVGTYRALVFDSERVLGHGEVWRLLTALVLHDARGAGHLVVNMLMLFFFGREVEQRLGRRRYGLLLLGAGLAGTLLLTLLGALGGQPIRALGASGAVYGVLAWLATRDPRRTMLFFGLLPMPLWVLVGVLMIGGDGYAVMTQGLDALASVGHLAGAGVGFATARRGGLALGTRVARPRAVRAAPRPPAASDTRVDRERLDALLAKISAEGLGALSDEERSFLEEASRRLR